MMYSQDYDEQVFSSWMTTPAATTYPGGYQWPQMVGPYVKNWQIFVCPSDSAESIVASNGAPGSSLSYGINVAYYAGSGIAAQTCTRPTACAMAQIADPSGTLLLMDCGGNFEVGWGSVPGGGSWSAQPANMTTFLGTSVRHNGGSNVAFCDGHAKWLAVGSIGKQNANTVYSLWTCESD